MNKSVTFRIILVILLSFFLCTGCGKKEAAENKSSAIVKPKQLTNFISPLLAYIKEKKALKSGKIKQSIYKKRTENSLKFEEKVEREIGRGADLFARGNFKQVIRILEPLSKSSKLSKAKKCEIEFMLARSFEKTGESAKTAGLDRKVINGLKDLQNEKKDQLEEEGIGQIFLIDQLMKRDGEDPEEIFSELGKSK